MNKKQELSNVTKKSNIQQIKPGFDGKEKENKEQKEKIIQEQNNEFESKQENLEMKSKILNKPQVLLEFDAALHFKENIHNTDKNSILPITENSYYCIQCKHSECPLYKENINQKEHLLIKRTKCLFYENNFFENIDSSIKEALTYNQFKNGIKEYLSNSIEILKNELDKLKEQKFQEIDSFFEETDKYLLNLKNKYLNVRQCIEDYYKVNQKFFNIEIIKEINNNINNNTNNNQIEIKVKSPVKTELSDNATYNINIEDINSGTTNRDIENSVFLLNFEMMNLCETKNLEIINLLKNLKIRINSFNASIQTDLVENIDKISKFFNINFKSEKIDDYYWDIVIRTKKYSEMIQQFRETITDIYHSMGNIEKIKDLIDIFDSKLKKNNKVIFDQKYFQENNLTTDNYNRQSRGPGSPRNERSSRKRKPSLTNLRSNSKSKLNSQREKSSNKLQKGLNDSRTKLRNYRPLTLSNDIALMNLQKNKNEIQKTEGGNISPTNTQGNLENKKSTSISTFQKILSFNNVTPDDVILDQRVIERFFAYSISELYSKNFIQLDPDNEANYTCANKDNIYLNRNKSHRNSLKNNNKQNSKKSARGHSLKKNKTLSYNTMREKFNNFKSLNGNILSNLKYSKGFNNNNMNNNTNKSYMLGRLDSDKFDSNQYNIKSVSYLANYTNRYNSLKEMAKPIIGTNQIQLFSPNNQKMVRKTTTLNRDEHGYNLFPAGCRHILVEDNLYIIGGTNHVRIPINIVLVYHIPSGVLKRLPDLNTTHSYHTVEYLENYDSIICIGGENSSSCEIMNLENKKWYKLPNLNVPRANSNIYLNNINGELFVLFGICGIMSERINNYSDSIEVLELNDISQGWIKVDYYKTPGLNLRVNYCMTIPFTRNQLVVYGGSNMRSFSQNIYALFHMIKNECIKVDTQTMELIKLEEKKSRLVDLALTKLG